jgi:hypothetical protein
MILFIVIHRDPLPLLGVLGVEQVAELMEILLGVSGPCQLLQLPVAPLPQLSGGQGASS